MPGAKPVLGLFKNEDELRDHLAERLTIVEPQLALITTNFVVENPAGASGAFDILAKDRFGNFVIIEVKRSEQAARQALHELSKYIALFMEDQKVDSHRIRCFVLSTHWHELDIPLSFFADYCPVQVKGFEITLENQAVVSEERVLPKVSLQSRLSPDMRFYYFASAQNQQSFSADLQRALSNAEHVRAAVIVMEPIGKRERMSLLCVWRVPDKAIGDVKKLIFNPDFQEEIYLHPGWEIETDLCDWLEDQSDKAEFVFYSDTRATPEKVENQKVHHHYAQLVKLGDWPRNDLVNNLDEIMRCLTAKDVDARSTRSNRYRFSKASSKSTGKAWSYASEAFASFIGHTPFWLSMYQQIASEIPDDATVEFEGYDMRHFYYAVHQGTEYPGAELSAFGLIIKNNDIHVTVEGGWMWDGLTRPQNALANIEKTYGNLPSLWHMIGSAVDQDRYESVYEEHGFFPYVFVQNLHASEAVLYGPDNSPTQLDTPKKLQAFIAANPDYCAEVSECLKCFPRNFATVE
ncbi:endonuclease NucS domain-containing protein [Pseudomonas palmensis]|uniref:endonuclease NucS domain-containing protein n=1 Tax=Pseudomonas palmensis TaxID=2815362 RepID=UPI003CF8C9D4